MKTFYDFRTPDWNNPKKFPLQGKVIFRLKDKWLLWIYHDKNSILDGNQLIKGFIVCPKTIYLYDIYLAKNIWDSFRYLFKKTKK
jgi:hypothetical protein